jgi:hypothetical protein
MSHTIVIIVGRRDVGNIGGVDDHVVGPTARLLDLDYARTTPSMGQGDRGQGAR